MNSTILDQPLQPSLLRQCPYCQKLWTLRKTRTEQHAVVGEVRVYHCKACGKESQYVASHPPNVL
jgi:hypothetical protein